MIPILSWIKIAGNCLYGGEYFACFEFTCGGEKFMEEALLTSRSFLNRT